MQNIELILASKSEARARILSSLGLQFKQISADIDERAYDAEPGALALQLAEAKALTVSRLHSESLVIGCDQVAHCDGLTYHQPGSATKAVEQLLTLSGRILHLESALCLSLNNRHASVNVTSQIRFKTLTEELVRRYVARDMPIYMNYQATNLREVRSLS